MEEHNEYRLSKSFRMAPHGDYDLADSITVYVTRFAKRGLIHASDFATLMRHNFICGSVMKLKFTDSKVSPQNFRALGKPQAKLCFLEVEKLDACIRPLFAIWSHMYLVLSQDSSIARTHTYAYTILVLMFIITSIRSQGSSSPPANWCDLMLDPLSTDLYRLLLSINNTKIQRYSF